MFGMKTYSKLGDEFDVGRRQQFSLHCAHNNSFLFMYDTYTYLPLYPDMIKETMVVFYLKPFLLTHHPQVSFNKDCMVPKMLCLGFKDTLSWHTSIVRVKARSSLFLIVTATRVDCE